MEQQEQKQSSMAMRIAIAAVLTAMTAVFTLMVRVPIAPTRGYINLGDVAIYFSAFTFGPVTALIASGLGTSIADLIAGYPQWAPITFCINAVRGLVTGLIIHGLSRSSKLRVSEQNWAGFFSKKKAAAAGTAGMVIMVGLYFLAGGIMYGFPAAAFEIPGNIIQNVVGILLGSLLSLSVYRAYPPVQQLRW